ncbi:BrnA antitoxin family protein [Bradyrhizobium guangzhouense]|uniref:BrnA antitoxin family protein n=1 Tax=Bradyrhizobium guangzhouense TaxID=1325095 RepID=A0AAE5X366_9BRAD|nr:BrnA antitoxin family protein [Bradyrhizobium guangzhouense]QAU48067.1 hypothetical protein XH91_23800 [Bradyrhizobium guangzhouense]RXH14626.1 hypothetical protein EAS56_12350 [Bradyrhizobium guangzhouense]RXH20113.1 hypothetical protein EAS54_03770 [Bradyrhizobium guangzhouense]
MKKAAAKKGYTARDLRAVSDNPEWTKGDFAKARTFDEVFPTMRKGRGPNKAPTKQQVTLRLSPDVVDYFKAEGPGWQSRIDETLVKVVKRKRSSATG